MNNISADSIVSLRQAPSWNGTGISHTNTAAFNSEEPANITVDESRLASMLTPQWTCLGRSRNYTYYARDARCYHQSEFDRVRQLLDNSYYASEMGLCFEDSIKNGDPVLGAIARSHDGEIVAARHIRFSPDDRHNAICSRVGVDQLAVGRWFSVDPNCRGGGIGKAIMSKLNRVVFRAGHIPAIFGSSLSIGSVKLYRKMGAGLYINDIGKICPHADHEQNLKFFDQFVSNSEWNEWRGLPRIRYAWTLSPVMKRRLETIGFKFDCPPILR